jgi:hypothetical protein
MKTRILAAALVAPMIALGPTTAWAHYCSRHYHHHHHARSGEKQNYGSSRQMQNNSGSSKQDLNNQGTGQSPGSTDQGVGGSSGTSGRHQGI